MQVKKQRIAVALVAAALGLANAGVQALEPIPPDQGRTSEQDRDTYKPQDTTRSKPAGTKQGQQIKASKLIGKEVKSEQGERLGKVEDLIINSSHTVNFAIISSRGALGLGDKHIAVPIKDLNCSGDGITLSATGDRLKNASKMPTGGWMAVSGEEWTRDIDGYYGQPQEFSMTGPRRFSSSDRTFERDQFDAALEREPVRAVQGDGARQLITHPDHANLFDEPLLGNEPTGNSRPSVPTPSDETMQQRISDSLQQIYPSSAPEAVSVTVQDGVVTLRGTVANATEKRNIETTVKQTSGVRRVNNQLTVQSR